jgi:hypothetical protein
VTLVAVAAVAVAVAVALVKAPAATLLYVFKWFETDGLIAKRENVATGSGACTVF